MRKREELMGGRCKTLGCCVMELWYRYKTRGRFEELWDEKACCMNFYDDMDTG